MYKVFKHFFYTYIISLLYVINSDNVFGQPTNQHDPCLTCMCSITSKNKKA